MLGELPAFPVPENSVETGISRRDWFAAVALQGLAAKGLEVCEDRVLTDQEKNHILCSRAYALADTMVAVAAETSKKRKVRRKKVRRSESSVAADADSGPQDPHDDSGPENPSKETPMSESGEQDAAAPPATTSESIADATRSTAAPIMTAGNAPQVQNASA